MLNKYKKHLLISISILLFLIILLIIFKNNIISLIIKILVLLDIVYIIISIIINKKKSTIKINEIEINRDQLNNINNTKTNRCTDVFYSDLNKFTRK